MSNNRALFRDAGGCVHVFVLDPKLWRNNVMPRAACPQAFIVPVSLGGNMTSLRITISVSVSGNLENPNNRVLDYTPVDITTVVTCLQCVCAR